MSYMQRRFAAAGGTHIEGKLLKTQHFGLPQSRCRAVLLGVRHRAEPQRQYLDLLDVFRSAPFVGLDEVVQHEAVRPPTERPKLERWREWQDDWADQSRLAHLNSVEKREAALRSTPCLWKGVCTQRQSHLVLLHLAKLGLPMDASGHLACGKKHLLLVDQEVHRTRPRADLCPCVTPGGRLLDLEAMKFLSAQTKAAFQGFDAELLTKFGYAGSSRLSSYVGNAFPATLCLLWLIAALDALADSYCLEP